MDEPTSSIGSSKLADELAGLRRADLATALRYDLTSYRGPSISYGIMLAGAAYPVVLVAIYSAIFIVQVVASLIQMPPGQNLVELAVIPVILIGYAALGSLLGIIWAGVLSMMTLPVVYLVARSLKLRGSLIGLGALSGGLVGFIALLPLTWILRAAFSQNDFVELLIALAFGPGLATVLGQLGGAWGGWRAWRSSEHFYGIAIDAASSITAPDAGDRRLELSIDAPADVTDHRLQFGLRHMMWLIVWISVLLCVIRLSGIPFEYVLPLIAGWIVFQWITLRVGERLVRSLRPRWVGWRSLRST